MSFGSIQACHLKIDSQMMVPLMVMQQFQGIEVNLSTPLKWSARHPELLGMAVHHFSPCPMWTYLPITYRMEKTNYISLILGWYSHLTCFCWGQESNLSAASRTDGQTINNIKKKTIETTNNINKHLRNHIWNTTNSFINKHLLRNHIYMKHHHLSFLPFQKSSNTVDGRNPAPVDMVKYPIIYRVSYIPGGCLGFRPSTVALNISQKNIPQPGAWSTSVHASKGGHPETIYLSPIGILAQLTDRYLSSLKIWWINRESLQFNGLY